MHPQPLPHLLRLPLPLACALATALSGAACHQTYVALAPQARTPLPAGAALEPWSAANPTRSAPQLMAYGQQDNVTWVTLTNLDANYAPGGPGLLVRLDPHTGAQTVVDLGGSDGHACTNAGVVKNEGGLLLVTCSGGFGADLRGRAVVQVDQTTNAVSRVAVAPPGLQPSTVVVIQDKIWVGDFSSARLFSLDPTTFSWIDGADAAHPPITLPCPAAYTYVSDLLGANDLFALCAASDGYLVRLDPASGLVKGDKVLVGAQPLALAYLWADGRIAVVNSVSGTLSLVTIDAGPMTVQLDALALGKTAALQDVRVWQYDHGNYVYTVASGTNTVQKLDLPYGTKDLTKAVVAEVNTGDNGFPWSILPLDENQAIVANNGTGDVIGVNFAATK